MTNQDKIQSLSSMTSNNSNFSTNTSNFWSNGGYRKRKITASDFEENSKHKMFLTEEKLIKNMQTLSLDLSINNKTSISQSSQQDDENLNQNKRNNLSQGKTRFELHKLLKHNLRINDLHDSLITKLYDLERKKLSMQIVPYMPIHPAQLNNNNNIIMDEKEVENENKISSAIKTNEIKKENDDHLFKKPFLPTSYIVEEPCDDSNKPTPRMKRSYSQSVRSNSNLSFVELKNDTNNYSVHHSQSDYFIVEPSTPALVEPSTNQPNSSILSNRSSIRITEYFDFPSSSSSSNNNFSKSYDDDNIDIQLLTSFDTNDKMDDDI